MCEIMRKYGMETTMFIDPGTRSLGWSVWKCRNGVAGYVKGGAIRARITKAVEGVGGAGGAREAGELDDPDWVQRADFILEELGDLLLDVRPGRVIIELPSTYSGGKGNVAGASGSVMKLMGMVMAIRSLAVEPYSYLSGDPGAKALLLPVMKWKGQVKKELVHRRLVRRYGFLKKELEKGVGGLGDFLDAVGMGDWYYRKHRGFRMMMGKKWR